MHDLKHKAAFGVRWTTFSTAIVFILQITQLSILARLLHPDDFGQMAIVIVLIGIARIFSDFGLSEALIQRKHYASDELSSLYWFNIGFGILVFFCLWALTPLITATFSVSTLDKLLPVVGIGFLIEPVASQFGVLARKRLEFRLLATIEIAASTISVATAVISASIWQQGVWSLVWAYLAAVTLRTVMLFFYGYRAGNLPTWSFGFHAVRPYLQFGLFRVGAKSLNNVASRVDQLLIGGLMGTQILGYYSVANNLILQSVRRINPIIIGVAFPIFSTIQDDLPRLRQGYFRMMRLLMSINAPLMIGFAAVAPLLIPIMLGRQWSSIIPLTQLFAVLALMRSLGGAGASIVLAKGRADLLFYWNIAMLLIMPAVVYIVATTGDVLDVVWALVLLQIVISFAHYKWVIQEVLGPCFSPYCKAISLPVVLSFVMYCVLTGLQPFINSLTAILQLIILIMVGVIVYLSLLLIFDRTQTIDNMRLVIER